MRRGINCKSDQAKFDHLNKICQQYCVDNLPNYTAVKWCKKIVHPVSGDIAFTVKDKVLPALTKEQSEIIELTKEWFPADPDLS